MYKLFKNGVGQELVIRLSDNANIPFDQANNDYQQFKADVLARAQLHDADGIVQTDASAYNASLP
jgi:hypothetical protein